jgi:hypothetical protein
MDAQAGANTPGWLHHPATRLEQASTDVLEKKMTDATPNLEAIRARSEAATSGPWQTRDVGYVFAATTSVRAAQSGYDGTPIVDTFMWPEDGEANQVFIAHAREDIPALLDALDAITAERNHARQIIKDAPHTKACFEDSFDYGDGCRCWKSGI